VKTRNNKAWFLVLPVILVVSFTALLPLMTVANYAIQDIFSPDNRLFVGMKWFYDITNDPLIIDAFQRSFQFSIQALLIQIPLGIAIARIMPKSGWKASAE
jgi:glycerol transport system permease protein